MEADLHQLANAFNQNTQLFSHGLTIAELHLRVHERAMNDLLNGCVRFEEKDGKKTINFRAYLNELVEELKAQEAASQAAAASQIQPPTQDDVLVFGGP